jgi:hypothetical protein
MTPWGAASTRRDETPDTRESMRTTCPRDCFDTCGIAVVKRNGMVAPRPRRPTPSGQPGEAVRQVLDQL